MSSHYKKWGTAAAVLGILGAILLLVSAAMAWYQISSADSGTTATYNLNPGSSYSVTCSGSNCGLVPTGSQSYSSAMESHEQSLYGTLYYLIIAGGVLALIGAVLAFLTPRLPKSAQIAPLLLILIGLILGIAAVGYVAGGQTSAYSSDATSHGQSAPPSGTSWPGGSFIGSSSNGGATQNWGPGVGFYLGVVAVVMFLLSVVFMVLAWRAMKHDGPAAPMAPMAPAATPPPASPPGGM